jgi:hypothetical protein
MTVLGKRRQEKNKMDLIRKVKNTKVTNTMTEIRTLEVTEIARREVITV